MQGIPTKQYSRKYQELYVDFFENVMDMMYIMDMVGQLYDQGLTIKKYFTWTLLLFVVFLHFFFMLSDNATYKPLRYLLNIFERF